MMIVIACIYLTKAVMQAPSVRRSQLINRRRSPRAWMESPAVIEERVGSRGPATACIDGVDSMIRSFCDITSSKSISNMVTPRMDSVCISDDLRCSDASVCNAVVSQPQPKITSWRSSLELVLQFKNKSIYLRIQAVRTKQPRLIIGCLFFTSWLQKK